MLLYYKNKAFSCHICSKLLYHNECNHVFPIKKGGRNEVDQILFYFCIFYVFRCYVPFYTLLSGSYVRNLPQ